MEDNYVEGELLKPDWTKDPDTGKMLPIEKDQSWRDALKEFRSTECKHENSVAMRVTISDGRTQVMHCCTNCGERSGTPISQKNRSWVESLPLLPPDLVEGYSSRRARERHTVMLALARRQYQKRGRFTAAYREYLASAEWQARRVKVMRRCGGTCEGCGDRSATEVHHLTYRHLMEEFLFELVGLCEQCHDRYHSLEENKPERTEAA